MPCLRHANQPSSCPSPRPARRLRPPPRRRGRRDRPHRRRHRLGQHQGPERHRQGRLRREARKEDAHRRPAGDRRRPAQGDRRRQSLPRRRRRRHPDRPDRHPPGPEGQGHRLPRHRGHPGHPPRTRQIGRTISKGLAAGATGVSGPSFTVGNEEEAFAKVLAAAFAKAKERAASSPPRPAPSLGQALTIEEGSGAEFIGPRFDAAGGEEEAASVKAAPDPADQTRDVNASRRRSTSSLN